MPASWNQILEVISTNYSFRNQWLERIELKAPIHLLSDLSLEQKSEQIIATSAEVTPESGVSKVISPKYP